MDRLVDRLEGDVEHAPQGPFYHLRDQSSIKGALSLAAREHPQKVCTQAQQTDWCLGMLSLMEVAELLLGPPRPPKFN